MSSIYTLHAVPGATAVVGGTFVIIGLIHAFVLMMLIQTLGGVSGGHFNPAVTLGLAVARKIKPDQAAVYMLMQLIGAIAGAADVQADPQRHRRRAAPEAEPRQPVDQRAAATARPLLGGLCELVGNVRARVGGHGRGGEPARSARLGGFVIGATLGFGVFVFGAAERRQHEPGRALGPAIVAGEFARGLRPLRARLRSRAPRSGPDSGGGLQAARARARSIASGERPVDKLA